MKVLKTDITNFSHIVHVADLHVRLLKRHSEYSEVFNRFYDEVKKTPPTTTICILGDVFHNKTDLQPECVQSVKDFLFECANLRPTILVAGNHDGLIINKNRLDSLSPMVSALNHPNLHYLKENGIYGLGDILFNNMSVFVDVTEYIQYDKIPKVYRNKYVHHIALYHGPVNGANTDLGFTLVNKAMPVEIFDGHHIALIGDIHKAQNLQEYNDFLEKPAVRYPGSLIQQSHGEPVVGHGFSLWDLDTKTYTHVEIPNDYGFFTVEVKHGKLVTDLTGIPKKARVRMKCFESVTDEVKEALKKVKESTVIDEVSYVRVETDASKIQTPGAINLSSVSDVVYQNTLLETFLKDKCKITDTVTITAILELNKFLNGKLDKDKFARNIRWKPKKFEFDNMFSYGEGNVIDFSKIKNAVGLFAPNACGKSSIFSALSFCLFDKFDRGYKAGHVLNVQKSNFRCKFNFEINGVDFFIERKGVADRKGNVKVDVKFWKEEHGKKTELNGEARRNTNDIVTDYLGSYDDFILTALSVQNSKNSTNFIDMGQSERKDLIAQFIGLTIFDRLLEVATEESKDIFASLKLYKKDDYNSRLKTTTDEHSSLTSVFNDESKKLKGLQESRDELNEKLLEETKRLKVVDGKDIDINKVEEGIKQRNIKLKELNTAIIDISLEIEEFDEALIPVDADITEFDRKNIPDTLKKHQRLTSELSHLNQSLEMKRVEVQGKIGKLEMLKKHEYDPNCKYCVNSIFVKDAKRISGELEDDKVIAKQIVTERDKIKKELAEIDWVTQSNTEYTDLLRLRNLLKDKLTKATTSKVNIGDQITKIDTELSSLNKLKEDYNNQLDAIEFNRQVQAIINGLQKFIETANWNIDKKTKEVSDMNGRLMVLKSQMDQLTDTIVKIKTLETQYDYYSAYMKAVNRDGIPYMVISNVVPEIEKEVNNILNQIVEFHISIETDGKNVNPYIVYDDCKWPVEMASGFEKFIISLAIRVALTNISNLPRPNFSIIDEGWGTMDSDNLSQVKILLSFMKSNFEFIIIISHLDSIKDSVDSTIEITKINGFSHVELV